MATALGKKIRQAREEAGFTAERMAPKVGVTMGQLLRYERGDTKRISVDRLTAIAKATGKPMSFFLNGDSERAA